MRTHRKHRPFSNWCEGAVLEELSHLRYLAAARLEPIVRGLRGGAILDLMFCRGDRIAVVPFIEIAPEMLLQRESSPFVWPEDAASVLGDDRIDDLERVLLAWIQSLTLARQLNAETIRIFGDDSARKLFEAARSAGFPGAAPYAQVLQDAAPYVYAVRFAEDARIAACDAQGAFGSALLSRYAREVRADLGDSARNALARQWFGKQIFEGVDRDAAYDVVLCSREAEDCVPADVRIVLDGSQEDGVEVAVATPVPTDVMLAFDSAPSPVCRTFSVRSSAGPNVRAGFVHAPPHASGGSSGRVLMLMRNDFERAPDADTDDANALAAMLRAEGFSVDLRCASAALPSNYDLVHAFTIARVDELDPALRAAQAAGIPVVLSPYFQDVSAGGAWGTGIVRALIRVANDETELDDNLSLLAQRRLEGPGLSAKRQEPFAGYDAAVRSALQRAGALLVCGAKEERRVREFGYTGAAFSAGPCLLPGAAGARSIRGDFVFAHAPLEARSNLLLLVRAAASARLPLVIAGPATEPEYVLTLREQAGERTIIIGEPDEASASSLYRTAGVYADVSWIAYGTHRSARAAACGAGLVLAEGSCAAANLGPDVVWKADPASQASIETALRAAWAHTRAHSESLERAARRAADLGDARTVLLAAVQAYAAAQQVRSRA